MTKTTKHYSFLMGFIIISLALFAGCSDAASIPVEETGNSGKLDRLNWSNRNYAVLNQMIKDYGKGGKYYDSSRQPYAVLDWDQTCAHFDTEEAVMRYQISNLRYKMTGQEFRSMLKDEINGVRQLAADFQNIYLKDID